MSRGTTADVRRARRVLCAGATGSGKTVLARRLGAVLDLPVVLMDDLMWRPGWVEVPREEGDAVVTEVLRQPAYVLDTAYRRHTARALAAVDVVVALDYPRPLSLARLVRRTARNIITREPLCNGNTESLRQALGSRSILLWHFRSWRDTRERIRAWEADTAGPPVVVLRRPSDAERLLDELGHTPSR